MALSKDYQPREILISQPEQAGKVILKLDEVRQARGLSVNQLSLLLGTSYATVSKYCHLREPGLVDLNLLCKCCYVLDCDISDLVEYQPPKSIPKE